MKKILLLLGILLLVAGCQSGTESGETVVMDDGETKVTTTAGDTDEWCQEGATWSATNAEASANMVIIGLVSSGDYAGYCHVKYDVDSADTQANVDLYFKEDGSGYQVINVNGQTF